MQDCKPAETQDTEQVTCPYHFFDEFDDWFYFWECIHYHKLTPEQARLNVGFRRSGWRLAKGFVFGMWVLSKR